MRIAPKFIVGAAVVALLGAGVAEAATAKLHTMKVAAPDGQVVEVHYTGDVAPQVAFVPTTAVDAAAYDTAAYDPFAQMDRISAAMDAQMQAMMQQAALLQRQARQSVQHAVANGDAQATAPGVTMVGTMPAGVHVSYYSSSTDANGCTRTVAYSSDGSSAQPKVTQAASDGCEAAKPNGTAIPVKAEAAPAASLPAHKV